MTDNEIVKALECCAEVDECEECPLCESCNRKVFNSAIDLINRQKVEIDELTRDTIPKLRASLARANKYGSEADKEIDRLRNTVKTDFLTVTEKLKLSQSEIGDIRAEAIKEFEDKAIKRICERVVAPTPTQSYIVERLNEEIHNLAKEMTEQITNKN